MPSYITSVTAVKEALVKDSVPAPFSSSSNLNPICEMSKFVLLSTLIVSFALFGWYLAFLQSAGLASLSLLEGDHRIRFALLLLGIQVLGTWLSQGEGKRCSSNLLTGRRKGQLYSSIFCVKTWKSMSTWAALKDHDKDASLFCESAVVLRSLF